MRVAHRHPADPLVRLSRLRGFGLDVPDVLGCRNVPCGSLYRVDPMRGQPGVHTGAQTLGPKRKPALPIDRMIHQRILEAPKCALSIDRDVEPSPELLVLDRRDEALHPSILLARGNRIDPEVAAVADDARVHRRVSNPIDDTNHLAGVEVQVAVHLRCVVFKCVFECLPSYRYL